MDNTATDTAAFPDAIQDETIEEGFTPPESPDTYFEMVECELTEEELGERRVQLESIDREIIRLEEKKKAESKVVTGEIKVQKAKKDGILAALDSGSEKRQVECYEYTNDKLASLGEMQIRRLDNHKIVDRVAMSEADKDEFAKAKQGDLFDTGGSNPPPADDDADDEDENFEPTPEALAQAAEDEGRVVKTSSAEVRKKRASKKNGAATETAGE